MKRSKLLVVLLSMLLIAVLVGCAQEGPAEQAGEKLDEAVDEVGGKMEKAGEAAREKAEEMKGKAEGADQ